MDEFLPDYTVSHPKQQYSSHSNCEVGKVFKNSQHILRWCTCTGM